jgi:acyl-CoA thioester hydrolase
VKATQAKQFPSSRQHQTSNIELPTLVLRMARIKILLPKTFSFFARIPVRITDVNYGNHLGNDALLSLIHEARMQYLKSLGFTEMEFAGVSLIMSDAAIEFKAEAFYGDVLKVYVTTADFSKIGFDLYYELMKEEGETTIAVAKTGMVCFDYNKRKVTALPQEAREKMSEP